MTHILKIKPQFFNAIISGKKRFEIRLNDRNYQEGDEVILNEFNNGSYTGKSIRAIITYILNHDDFPDGIPQNYVVFNIKILSNSGCN